jgi:ATP-dependent helicase/nuclease subunit B
MQRAADLAFAVNEIDNPGRPKPAARPAPQPPVALRPKQLSVTEVDRLKADPYAFYARRMLRLMPLDPVDADPSAAWRGTAVHAVLQRWFELDGCAPDKLRARAEAMLGDERTHPMMRALWQPRLMEAIGWIAEQIAADPSRKVIAVEKTGAIRFAEVELRGTFDRIDRMADGSLAIVDYKTGKPPSLAAVREGFSLQLGLLGLIAERGGFEGIEGRARCFEYWSLSKNSRGSFGYVESPCDSRRRDYLPADDFIDRAVAQFEGAARMWLTGDEPFTAKLHPDYAPYAEYDQLMRRDEWYGRD